MLDVLRKNAGSWWIKTILIAVALSFIIGFGILNRMSNKDRSRYVALVGDSVISPDSFNDQILTEKQNYQEKYGTEMPENDIINMENSILENQIDRILEMKEAKRIGIVVSDTEVADIIAQDPMFQKDGEFDYDTYKDYLDNYLGYTESGYENLIRENLMVQKLKYIVSDSTKASDADVLEIAKSQGKEIKSLDELSPDEREYYTNLASAVKRFTSYRVFLDSLKAQVKIDINNDYLTAKKEK